MTFRHWAATLALLLLAAGAAFLASGNALGGPATPPAALQETVLPPPRPQAQGRLPRVAIVAHNSNTELTDFVVPYGILQRSGAAEVWALGVEPSPIQLFPAFRVEPDAGIDAFDARHPDGADYVIVPAVHEDSDPRLLAWVQSQWRKGATVIGVCDGVWVLARAGLLDGRRATSHWYSRDALARQFPGTQWVSGQRYVVDQRIVTTTGVSASIPASLALVQTLAGPQRAQALARELGAAGWDTAHPSAEFRLTARHLATAAGNWLAFWGHERLQAALTPGGDDVALALVADAYARSYRTTVDSVSSGPATVRMASGLVFLPDTVRPPSTPSNTSALPRPTAPAVAALDQALVDIGQRYGQGTAAFVALQLEYPAGALARSINAAAATPAPAPAAAKTAGSTAENPWD